MTSASSPFDSAWLKWGRAVVHAQALDRELARVVQRFQTQRPYTTRTEYDPKHHCVRVLVDRAEQFPPLLGLLIGDAASNFRASLDHLAWAIVTTRGRRPIQPREESRIYFPIALRKEDFNTHLIVNKLLTRADRAILRRYQPYVHGERKAPFHCLSSLPRITADDKHRIIRPLWAIPQAGEIRVGSATNCEVTRIPTKAKSIILEPDAEVQRIYVRRLKRAGPEPDVYAEITLQLLPTVDGLIGLKDWMNQTTMHIAGLLFQFAEPPSEIRTLGIVPPRPNTRT
jgi:hypothetical protein